MVKTRHGIDEEASPGGEFLSLRTRSAKRYSRGDMEEPLMLSGDDRTPRSKRQRTASIGARSSSSDDLETVDRSLRRTSYNKSVHRGCNSRQVASPMQTRGRSATPAAAAAPRDLSPPSSPKNPEERRKASLSKSREYRSLARDGLVDLDIDDGDDDGEGIRRSRRTRKQIYGTMNQNLLTEMMLAGGTNPSPDDVMVGRKRRSKRGPVHEESDDSKDEQEEEGDEEDEARSNGDNANESGMDMYSRIKSRQLKKKKKLQQELTRNRDEVEEEESDSNDDEEEDESEDDSDEESEEEDEEEQPTQYSLRQHRTTTKRYSAPLSEPHKRKTSYTEFMNPNSPLRRRHMKYKKHLEPVRSAAHNVSSTSSSESEDERRFERRKKKSMARARNRCLPMNLNVEDLAGGVISDRQRIGSSLADVDPMTIDQTVSFEEVGGLRSHVQALKEMVVFPLLYPEVFERFKIAPPRGVLFHGPPGTGKTLVARALANECRQGDRQVAFFMRKGADCLSKWVGESERQLRLLFDQAYTMRPSIIFFDEIDGLAPVRSSRQDQIHSSIVSTLLALMDGLDSRGEIVVIGATNRIDSIDPALRRPGRFDREFLFPLPSLEARTSILSIHTKQWKPKLSDLFVSEVAEKCVGYCGADLKALCTEAALFALRRRYPQIYTSKEKLQLDVSEILISAHDFHQAMKRIVPASQRSVVSPGRKLTTHIRPLLQDQFNAALDVLHQVFPSALYQNSTKTEVSSDPLTDMLQNEEFSDEEAGASIFDSHALMLGTKRNRSSPTGCNGQRPFLNFTSTSYHQPHAHRPRFLITGKTGMGQSSHLAPALLHHMERLPVHCLDLPALYACSAKTPEESCAQVFREARRTIPSIIYIPHIGQWWEACSATLQATFLMLLQDLPPSAPVLLLATSDEPLREMQAEVKAMFGFGHGGTVAMRLPRIEERREFFRDLILTQATKAPAKRKKTATNALEVLPVAPPREPAMLTEAEIKKLAEVEERKLRELRIFLRDVLTRLASERKFRVFTSPVDPEEVPDYADVIKNPMDLFTMNNKINLHQYTSARQFLSDIDLITSNALEYNPDKNPSDRMIRNRACELKDMAYAIIDAEMDSDFEKQCEEIEDSRRRRKENPTLGATAPSFYKTFHQLTLSQAQQHARELASQKQKSKLEVGSGEDVCETPCNRPKKSKKKVSQRKSAWSRGYVPKKNKYKKKQVIVLDSDEDDQEKKTEEENETDETLPNGDIFHHDASNHSIETSTAPSTLSQATSEDTSIHRFLQGSSHHTTLGNHNHSQHDSDKESVMSEPCMRHAPATSPSDYTGQRSPRPSAIDRGTMNCLIQNGIGSEESSEVEPPTLERVDLFPRVSRASKEHEAQNVGMVLDNGSDAVLHKEECIDGRNKQDTPTSGDSSKGKVGITSLRRSSRRFTKTIQADPVAAVTRQNIDEPKIPALVVDRIRLMHLLENVTVATTNFTTERLESLYCVLSQCVYRHRLSYDKTELTQEMEREVARFSAPSAL